MIFAVCMVAACAKQKMNEEGLEKLDKPCREELGVYLEFIKPMRYITSRDIGKEEPYKIWSIAIV